MAPLDARRLTRRDWLQRAGGGLGSIALAHLLGATGSPAAAAGRVSAEGSGAHFPSKAKSVIWLFMEGGPSAVDTFDPKPELDRLHGTPMDIDVFFGFPGPLMRSPFTFRQYGESGTWVCEHYQRLARHVDKLALLKGCHCESSNHVPALYQMNTGLPRPGFPSAGAWITYGLGSENENLPGFVVLGSSEGVKGGPLNWSSGFLPSSYQATLFRPSGDPIINLGRPKDVAREDQRAQLDLLAHFNRRHHRQHPHERDLEARIRNFELAYGMQTEARELIDFSGETAETMRLYGIDEPASDSYGRKCLLARRLVERGVRFVQVYCDEAWDAHNNLTKNHADNCRATDAPIAGLLTDLEQRGLLEETLVIWGGEFGRMPVSQQGDGRDHNPHGFLTWMAGAGIRGGSSYGATDEVGHKAVEDRTSVHDLHATMLHLLGVNHKNLTYTHNGRPYRLTDVAGDVLTPILA